jgi:hypothetical protein
LRRVVANNAERLREILWGWGCADSHCCFDSGFLFRRWLFGFAFRHNSILT